MDTLRITIKGEAPLSTNKTTSFNSKGRYYKNTKKDAFKEEIDLQCLKYSSEMEKFANSFNKKKEFLVINFDWKVPSRIFFNKDGSISCKKTDWDNTIKALQDSVFDSIGINDALIIDGSVSQRPTENEYLCDIHITRMVNDF